MIVFFLSALTGWLLIVTVILWPIKDFNLWWKKLSIRTQRCCLSIALLIGILIGICLNYFVLLLSSSIFGYPRIWDYPLYELARALTSSLALLGHIGLLFGIAFGIWTSKPKSRQKILTQNTAHWLPILLQQDFCLPIIMNILLLLAFLMSGRIQKIDTPFGTIGMESIVLIERQLEVEKKDPAYQITKSYHSIKTIFTDKRIDQDILYLSLVSQDENNRERIQDMEKAKEFGNLFIVPLINCIDASINGKFSIAELSRKLDAVRNSFSYLLTKPYKEIPYPDKYMFVLELKMLIKDLQGIVSNLSIDQVLKQKCLDYDYSETEGKGYFIDVQQNSDTDKFSNVVNTTYPHLFLANLMWFDGYPDDARKYLVEKYEDKIFSHFSYDLNMNFTIGLLIVFAGLPEKDSIPYFEEIIKISKEAQFKLGKLKDTPEVAELIKRYKRAEVIAKNSAAYNYAYSGVSLSKAWEYAKDVDKTVDIYKDADSIPGYLDTLGYVRMVIATSKSAHTDIKITMNELEAAERLFTEALSRIKDKNRYEEKTYEIHAQQARELMRELSQTVRVND